MMMSLCQHGHTKPFSVKLHWPKTKTSGIVELGVLIMVHYRAGFPNPVVSPKRGAKLEKIQK
jgi:hypothetical protein